jgi:predicted RND superfamily exporter protein
MIHTPDDNHLSSIYSCFATAFPIAFLALIAATANWILALYSIIAVGAIVSSVLATCQLQGWALGTGEAIAGVMVIGLSVDYTIHLAHMYDHAGHEQGFTKRMARFEYAIDTMAGTVLAGAITTCGAGLFMFLCVQTFFTKMATLIVLTIFMSALYALLWFMPLMAHFGPEDRQGFIDFSAIKKKLLCQS